MANLGEVNALAIAVRKDQHRSPLRRCRKVPYTDMIIEITLRNLYDKCPFPCKPGGVLKFCPGLRLSKRFDNLPLCTDEIQTKCFQESFHSAMQFIESYSGPCTKLEYQVSSLIESLGQSNEAKFSWSFDPSKVTVHEEYLIYDFVAMISAIGGTLGLCIRFSFTELVY